MGDEKVRVANLTARPEQQIEIEGALSPTAIATAPEPLFDCPQHVEHRKGELDRLREGNGVGVIPARRPEKPVRDAQGDSDAT
jgi:hypothetical protein